MTTSNFDGSRSIVRNVDTVDAIRDHTEAWQGCTLSAMVAGYARIASRRDAAEVLLSRLTECAGEWLAPSLRRAARKLWSDARDECSALQEELDALFPMIENDDFEAALRLP